MRHGYSRAEQSRAVFVLRRDIRKAHVDVRFNSKVAADCWRIIDAIENSEVDIQPPSSAAPPIRRNTTTNGKRKSLDSQIQTRAATRTNGKKKKAS